VHIPDGLIDLKLSAGLIGTAGAAVIYSLYKLRDALAVSGENTLYRMGMVAALIFSAQMFKFPIDNGTSVHLIGGALAAVLLGPFAGTVVISVVLTIQMLFFADGGVLPLGANIVNMALVGTILCYYIYYAIKQWVPEWLAIIAASWISLVLADFSCALEIGLSGTIPFGDVTPAMVKAYAVIGTIEAFITVALVYVLRSLLSPPEGHKVKQ